MYSFWEKDEFLDNDLIIIGGGFVGTYTAISILERSPERKILILERGIIPSYFFKKNNCLSSQSFNF